MRAFPFLLVLSLTLACIPGASAASQEEGTACTSFLCKLTAPIVRIVDNYLNPLKLWERLRASDPTPLSGVKDATMDAATATKDAVVDTGQTIVDGAVAGAECVAGMRACVLDVLADVIMTPFVLLGDFLEWAIGYIGSIARWLYSFPARALNAAGTFLGRIPLAISDAIASSAARAASSIETTFPALGPFAPLIVALLYIGILALVIIALGFLVNATIRAIKVYLGAGGI